MDRPLCDCHGAPMHRRGRHTDGSIKWGCGEGPKERSRAWHHANREIILPKLREYARTHKDAAAERSKRWARAHPDRIHASVARRRARLKQAVGPLTAEQWEAVVVEMGGRCVYCGSGAVTQDHDVPLTRGGHHERSNVVPACRSCNSSKHQQTGNEWSVTQLLRVATSAVT